MAGGGIGAMARGVEEWGASPVSAALGARASDRGLQPAATVVEIAAAKRCTIRSGCDGSSAGRDRPETEGARSRVVVRCVGAASREGGGSSACAAAGAVAAEFVGGDVDDVFVKV